MKALPGTNYDLTEAVTAGYLMNTLNFGDDVTFIAGVRLEQDKNYYHAYYYRSICSAIFQL